MFIPPATVNVPTVAICLAEDREALANLRDTSGITAVFLAMQKWVAGAEQSLTSHAVYAHASSCMPFIRMPVCHWLY